MTEHASSVSDRFGWLLRVARERKSRHELAVAIALAAHVNTRTGTAWPSTRTIADQCGVDLRHAWHALRRLADAGLLRVVTAGGPARTATYALELSGEQSEVTHPDASQRRTPLRRSDASRCVAATHRDASEHGASVVNTEERGVRAVSRARSASAARAARRAHSKKPKLPPF